MKLLIGIFSLFPCFCVSMMFESFEEIKNLKRKSSLLTVLESNMSIWQTVFFCRITGSTLRPLVFTLHPKSERNLYGCNLHEWISNIFRINFFYLKNVRLQIKIKINLMLPGTFRTLRFRVC